jgi:putative hydrolase of the HAD superfamily
MLDPQYRAILLDLDDTLLDDTHAMQTAVLALATVHEVPGDAMPDEIVRRWTELTQTHWRAYRCGELSLQGQRRERVRGLLGQPLPDAQADAVFDIYLAAYREHWRLLPGVQDFLHLTQALPRAVVSNGERGQAHRKLDALGLRGHFAAVLTPEDAGAPKPDPRMFLQAAALLGVAPGECLMIGDDFEADIAPAQALGMATFHVARGVAGRGLLDAVRQGPARNLG